jgi:hypothetical protein
MFGIRKINFPSLVLYQYDMRNTDPGPTMANLSYNSLLFETLNEAEEEIEYITKWYRKYRIDSEFEPFEPFELTEDDFHEMTVTALKWKK